MTTLTGLDKLKAEHKVFEFRNRGDGTRTIQLDGDSVQAQGGAIARVQSSMISQLPAFSDFEPVIPSVQQLIDAGLIGNAKEATSVPEKSADPESEEGGQVGGQTLKGRRS